MSNINAIQELFATERTIRVPKKPKEGQKQTELTLYDISIEDVEMIRAKSKDKPAEQKEDTTIEMLSLLLRISKEEVRKINAQYMQDILEYVDEFIDITSLSEEKNKVSKVNALIKRRQDALNEQKKSIENQTVKESSPNDDEFNK